MAQFLSGRRTNFNVGIPSVTENTNVLDIIGNVQISGIVTASRIFSSTYGEFTGGNISGTNLVGTALSISGISTLNAISAGGTTGTSQYVLTSTGTGLIWQAAAAITGVTGFNVAEDFNGGLKYLGMQTGAGTTQITTISSSQLVYNSTTKNLGIGTTNPTSKLTVQGDGKFTGVVTATTFIGNLTGYASTSGIATVAGYASTAGIATNLAGGAKNYIPYQTGVNTTAFIAYGNPGDVLTTDGANGIPYWAPLAVATVAGQITVRDEGNVVGSATSITQLDFRGANIVATANVGGNIATITVADYVSISGYSTNSGIATYAPNSGIATYATSAGIATYATSSGIATYATSAGIATYATSSGIATYATSAGISTYAPNSGIATYATSAGIATYATSSGIATYATNAGVSTNLKDGLAGNIVYQSSPNTTTFLANGTSGYVLQSNGVGNNPTWVAAAPANSITGLTISDEGTVVGGPNSVSTLNFVGAIVSAASTLGIATITFLDYVSYATTAGIATYATNSGIATYATSSGLSTYATSAGIATYATTAGIATYAANAGISTNLKGGVIGNIPYQSSANTTVFLTNGSSGTILQSNGVGNAPTWVTAAPAGAVTGITVRDSAGNTVGTSGSITQLTFSSGLSVTGTEGPAGIATIRIADNIVGTSLSISGISTFNTVQISSGIITSTNPGVSTVTYYGDGSKLTGLTAGVSISTNTTNQAQYLTYVTGTGTTTGFGITTTGLVFNPSSGNLGIGSATPTSKLTVQGNVLISGITTSGIIRISSSTVSPNASTPVATLEAVGASSNYDIAIVPKGNGAIVANIPDGTFVGGNKRGTYAVDLQLSRNGATQVASGSNSFIGGGSNNTSGGTKTFVGGGEGNSTGAYSFGAIVGGQDNAITTGSYCFIGGGDSHIAGSDYATIAGGSNNTASGQKSFIGGGSNNEASAVHATVSGGNYSTASGQKSFVGGGESNSAAATLSSVVGGEGSTVQPAADRSAILGGSWNSVNGSHTSILCASYSRALRKYSSVISGHWGDTRNTYGAVVFSGANSSFGTGFSAGGGYQQSRLAILSKATTDATPSTLTADGNTHDGDNVLAIPPVTAYLVKGSVIAYAVYSGDGDTRAWEFTAVIKRQYGDPSLVGTPIINDIAYDSGASGWNLSITADASTNSLKVEVIGQESTSIRWVTKIDSTEVAF